MSRFWRTLYSFVVAMLAVLPVGELPAQTGSMQGTVRNVVTNEPLARVRVTVVGTRWSDVTDAAGRYTITGITPGTYDVHAELVGFASAAAGDKRVTVEDAALLTSRPIPVDLWLRPVDQGGPPGDTVPVFAGPKTPGFGLGIAVGGAAVGGEAVRPVALGTGVQLEGRYGIPNGLSIAAGAYLSTHHMAGVSAPYRLQGAFIEPQFIVRQFASRVAPYVSLRFDVAREQVNTLRASFTATGYAVGGGGGILVQLAPLVSLDGGMTAGTVSLGDFMVRPDDVALRCLQGLAEGTNLPDAVVQCGEIKAGAAGYTCPPSGDPMAGECEKPRLLRTGTSHSGGWFRFWLGVRLALVDTR